MPAPTKLRIAQQYIQAIANMPPPRNNPDLAALIGSAQTNLLLMEDAPETAPVRALVNASGSDAMRHEEATRRAKHLTGSDSNNSGVLMEALCNLLEATIAEKTAAQAVADAEEPDTFTTPDNDLNLLLELGCDISKGRCNMDTGIWWLQTLEGILARLMPKDVVVQESWVHGIDKAVAKLAQHCHRDAGCMQDLQEIRAFLEALIAARKASERATAPDPKASAAVPDDTIVDGDITWIPMQASRLPEGTARILLADADGMVKQSVGYAVAELLAGVERSGVPCSYTHWADMPAVPTGSDLGAWKRVTDDALPERYSSVLVADAEGQVSEEHWAPVRHVLIAAREGRGTPPFQYWRPMPASPVASIVDQDVAEGRLSDFLADRS